MRYRILDQNGDMTFGSGQLNFYRDSPEAVAQAVMTTLKLWLGEWFIDQTVGVPYQQGVLGTNKKTSIEPTIRNAILNTIGVQSIESFSIDIDANTRTTKINATINTVYGPAAIVTIL